MSRWIVVHKLPNSRTVSHFGGDFPLQKCGVFSVPTDPFVVLRHEKKGCSTSPFDCEAGYAKWKAGWSPTKKAARVDGWWLVGRGWERSYSTMVGGFLGDSIGRHICKNFPEDGYILFVVPSFRPEVLKCVRDFGPSFHSPNLRNLQMRKNTLCMSNMNPELIVFLKELGSLVKGCVWTERVCDVPVYHVASGLVLFSWASGLSSNHSNARDHAASAQHNSHGGVRCLDDENRGTHWASLF